MNNEFKKTLGKHQTVYTLESATAGGTSSGSIASTDGNNLIAQESDKKKIPSSTPRNFVAKNAKTGGAGAHKDKKKAEKQGKVKHKKPLAEDHEIQMAGSELQSIAKDAMNLLQLIKRYSEMDGLDAWQQSKITKAADYLNAVHQSISGEQGVAEVFSNDKETGTTHKGGVVTKTTQGTKHTKTDYDDGNGEKGRKPSGEGPSSRYTQTPILDKDDDMDEGVDSYSESLDRMLERQLEPTMDLDAWNDNFQNADPQKYHQFKNKSPEKKK